MTTCRWTSSTTPRVLVGRHLPPGGMGCPSEDCAGCLPCTEPHCSVCARVHVEAGACPECIAATRDDLRSIAELTGSLPTETFHRGVNSEAAMLWGPTADPQAWRNRAMSAMMGRVPDAYLEDCRDEQHPSFVLGGWEQVYRDALDQPTDLKATLSRLVDYLDRQLHRLAAMEEPPFDDFARDLRGCRGHLEDVLQAGERDEKGAPCVQCEEPMVRVVTDAGAQDEYRCRRCHRTVSGDQYRYAVGVAYRANADRLTASDMADRFEMKASVVRVWGSRGLVRKRGTNGEGITLYDVADVEGRLDETDLAG